MPQNNTDNIINVILREAETRRVPSRRFLIAIDGRCASGKTTLANELNKRFGWAVFHMDDFFLRPEQRTDERLDEPGGNADRERFSDEVLNPLLRGDGEITFRPFSCRTQGFLRALTVSVGDTAVIEGAYCCHQALWDAYDLHIFTDVSACEQIKRIVLRNGQEGAAVFARKWIPLEEKYFTAQRVKEKCEFVFGNR